MRTTVKRAARAAAAGLLLGSLVGIGVATPSTAAPDVLAFGRIVDDTGAPAPGLAVFFSGGPHGDFVTRTTATGDFATDGFYGSEFGGLPAGTYTMYATEPSEIDDGVWDFPPGLPRYTFVPPTTVTIPEGGGDLGEFTIPRGGVLRATVVTPAGTKLQAFPVKAAGAKIPGYELGERWAQTDRKGILTLRGLPTGTWPLVEDFTEKPVDFKKAVTIAAPGQIVRGVKLVSKVYWSSRLVDRGGVPSGQTKPLAKAGEARIGVQIGSQRLGDKFQEYGIKRGKKLRLSLYRDGKRIKYIYVTLGKSKIFTIPKQPKGTHTYKWIWGGDKDTFRMASDPLQVTIR